MPPSKLSPHRFEAHGKHYRRGLVLGFSMAEVFLILLFLLLLTTVSYSVLVEEKVEVIEERLSASEEFVRRLTNANEQLRRLNEKRYSRLDLSREIVEISSQLKETEYQLETLAAEKQGLEVQLANVQHFHQLGEKILDVLRVDQQDLTFEDVPEYVGRMRTQLQAAREEVERALAQTKAVEFKLYSLSKRAGVDNFCWYDEVLTPDGTSRERGIKIFDIRIWNDKIEVVLSVPPAYGERYRSHLDTLPLDFLSVDGLYTDGEFLDKFRGLYQYGIDGLVSGQPAECRFQVWIWDNTGKRNKAGFKQKMRVVESYFYKLDVVQEPWPHS